jgi:hypothetical protein
LNVHRLCRVGNLREPSFIDIDCIGNTNNIINAITAIIKTIFEEFILRAKLI